MWRGLSARQKLSFRRLEEAKGLVLVFPKGNWVSLELMTRFKGRLLEYENWPGFLEREERGARVRRRNCLFDLPFHFNDHHLQRRRNCCHQLWKDWEWGRNDFSMGNALNLMVEMMIPFLTRDDDDRQSRRQDGHGQEHSEEVLPDEAVLGGVVASAHHGGRNDETQGHAQLEEHNWNDFQRGR